VYRYMRHYLYHVFVHTLRLIGMTFNNICRFKKKPKKLILHVVNIITLKAKFIPRCFSLMVWLWRHLSGMLFFLFNIFINLEILLILLFIHISFRKTMKVGFKLFFNSLHESRYYYHWIELAKAEAPVGFCSCIHQSTKNILINNKEN